MGTWIASVLFRFFQVHADPAVTTKAMSRILPCSCPAGKLPHFGRSMTELPLTEPEVFLHDDYPHTSGMLRLSIQAGHVGES